MWICRTCGVEHAERPEVCAICADERQWVPAEGQAWATLEELAAEGCRTQLAELEPDLYGLTVEPGVGIGQRAYLVRSPGGNLLWDPPGFLDDDAVRRITDLGGVAAIASSHPHMFGVQVQWSRALGGAPVLVAEADLEWVARPDPVLAAWSGTREIGSGITLTQPGGHFPGSAVAHWPAGAGGRGVLFSGDTIQGNPDRRSVTFMRSYPNRIPLSARVVERVAAAITAVEFDRMYSNLGGVIMADARTVVQRSAERYIGWVRGDFDHLT